jgi:hypothetical protein
MNEYNSLIARLKLSEIYFTKEQDETKVEKAINSLKEITAKLDIMLKAFAGQGIEVTDIEATEGFNIEYREKRKKIYGY